MFKATPTGYVVGLITVVAMVSILPQLLDSFVLSNHPLNTSDHLPVYASITITPSPCDAIIYGISNLPIDMSLLGADLILKIFPATPKLSPPN